MTEKYLGEGKGICGQSCLAVIERTSIKEILENWEDMGIEFKGYSGWKQLKEYLDRRGWNPKLLRMNNLGTFKPKNFYLLRVQWIGDGEKQDKPFYGWGHWSQASANTHFIIVHQGKIFCNETGWFDTNKLEGYLGNAVVTSAMKVILDSSKNYNE